MRNLVFVLLGLTAIIGCDSDPLQRATIEGKVTFDGRPIPLGEIRFVPLPGQQGLPVAGASIVEGAYKVTNKGGVPAGEFRVEFQMFVSSNNSGLGGTVRQVLPAKFNTKSDYTFTVPPGGKTLVQDYALQP